MRIKWKNNGRYKLLPALFLFDTKRIIDALVVFQAGIIISRGGMELKI